MTNSTACCLRDHTLVFVPFEVAEGFVANPPEQLAATAPEHRHRVVPHVSTRGDVQRHEAREQPVMLIRNNKEWVPNTPHNTPVTRKGHTTYTQKTHRRTHAQQFLFTGALLPQRRSGISHPILKSGGAVGPLSQQQLDQQGVVTP